MTCCCGCSAELTGRQRRFASKQCKIRYYLRDPAEKAQRREWAREYRKTHRVQSRLANKRNQIKRLYGLTLDEYEAILAQGCAICGATEGRMHLDHDHTTGEVRGCLCVGCNVGLGSFKDDPERLQKAITYLEIHSTKEASQPVFD